MDKLQTQELKKKIDKAKIVSFDLYDTLVFRKTRTPKDLFAYMEFQTGIAGFSKNRQKMQASAARYVRKKYGHPHTDLHGIYLYWSRFTKDVLQAEQTERRLEECPAVQNRVMYQAMQYASARGKRIIITSDMYLDKPEIEKILKRCSITQWDAIYVSSEIKKTKYEGGMYDYIKNKEQAKAGEILHIGDDQHSDINMARAKGIRTFWYRDKEADLAKSLYFSSYKAGKALPENEMAFWYCLGYQVGGPLYLGLCLWLKEKLGNKRLYCLSRDGANLVRLLPQFGITDTTYVYASRRALLLPHLTKIGKKELELLPPYSCGQTVGEVLSDLGLEKIPKTQLLEAGFHGYDAVIRGKCDFAGCRRLYKDNAKRILELSRGERAWLERYFASVGTGLFQKEVCFFDSGWNGTSQYLLQKIYESLHKKCSIRFFYAGMKNNAASRRLLNRCRYQSYFAEYLKKRTLNRLLASSAVLELFFSEDAPAVRCYGKDGVQLDAYKKRDNIRWINQGIEDYIRQNQALCRIISKKAAKRFGIYNLVRLVLTPDGREAECIGNMENADRFSAAGAEKKYMASISIEALRKNPLLDIYWEQGVYRHPGNARGVKAYVWCRQRAAAFYRIMKGLCDAAESRRADEN